MKISSLLILFTALHLTANTYSQTAPLSMKIINGTIADVFREIENQTNYSVLYKDNEIDISAPVNIEVENMPLSLFLLQTLGKTHSTFKVLDKIIVITPAEVALQPRAVTGKVTDVSGNPLPGVSVFIKGTTLGTITDIAGNYELAITPNAQIIVISFVGMITQEILIDERNVYDVVLRESIIDLDEVVVVGYGTQKKVSVTGAIVSVDGESFVKSPSASISHTLAGRVTGLTTVQYSGRPGADEPEIFVRGIGSLSTGRSRPLTLVDGVERPFSQLDPNEIQSISILKDASATAVYGIRGANGVIIVTTKRGVEGKPRISYSGSFGLQAPARMVESVSSYTYAIKHNEATLSDNPNAAVKFPDHIVEAFRTNSQPLIFPNTNWVDLLVKDVSPQSQHNINISGGSKIVKYFISLGAFNQNGLFENFGAENSHTYGYKRYNVRSNIDVNMTESTILSLTVGHRSQLRQEPGNPSSDGAFNELYWAVPFSGLIHEEKRIRIGNSYISNTEPAFKDGLYAIGWNTGFRKYLTNIINIDIGLTQKLDFITKGLDWRFKVANNYNIGHDKIRTTSFPSYDPYFRTDVDPTAPGDSTIVFRKSGSYGLLGYSESSSKSRNYYLESAFSYARDFGPHNITGLLLYNQSKSHYPSQYTDIPTGYVGIAARATYSYQLKYLVDFNLGYNGSENFAPGLRFGLFPAYGVGWVISEEDFFKIPESFISYFKLRATYGVVGNDNIGGARFLYLPDRYNINARPFTSLNRGYNFGTISDVNHPLAAEGQIGNPELTWEKSKKQNYGVDLRMINGKLGISADIFYELRNNILTTRNNYPSILAITLPAVNIGEVENRGYEVELSWRDQAGQFSYYMASNISYAKNKILYMDEIPQNVEWRKQTGKSVNARFAYVFDGFWSIEDAANYKDFPNHNYIPKPGDVRYKDLDDNGIINADDQKEVGFPDYPEYIGSLSGGFSYKGFDFTMLWTGVTNVSREVILLYKTAFGDLGDRGLAKYLADNAWTPETAETATLPRLTFTGRLNNTRSSSVWIYDASYIRLKNLEIGYRFSIPYLESKGISGLRISASGYNLLTFDKMKINDPEARSGPDYPMIRIFNFGIQANF